MAVHRRRTPPPRSLPPPKTKVTIPGEKTKFTRGKTWAAHFWNTNFCPPPPPLLILFWSEASDLRTAKVFGYPARRYSFEVCSNAGNALGNHIESISLRALSRCEGSRSFCRHRSLPNTQSTQRDTPHTTPYRLFQGKVSRHGSRAHRASREYLRIIGAARKAKGKGGTLQTVTSSPHGSRTLQNLAAWTELGVRALLCGRTRAEQRGEPAQTSTPGSLGEAMPDHQGTCIRGLHPTQQNLSMSGVTRVFFFHAARVKQSKCYPRIVYTGTTEKKVRGLRCFWYLVYITGFHTRPGGANSTGPGMRIPPPPSQPPPPPRGPRANT